MTVSQVHKSDELIFPGGCPGPRLAGRQEHSSEEEAARRLFT
jgi:hypothetical protein